jgi:5-methylcytosine-specific restriction endonuclease McrA
VSVFKFDRDVNFEGMVSIEDAISALYAGRAVSMIDLPIAWRSPSTAIPVPLVIKAVRPRKGRFPEAVPLTRENIMKRDETCQYCGVGGRLTIDHVVPQAHFKSGKAALRHPGLKVWCWENVVAACARCNNRKANRTPEEAGMRLLRRPFVPRPADILKSQTVWDRIAECMREHGMGDSSSMGLT